MAKAERKVVSNDEMMAALNNPDYRDLIASETLKYKGQLDEHQRESAGMTALWRALGYYKPLQKFTTSLWKFIHWECRRELRKERRRTGHGLVTRVMGDISDMPEQMAPPTTAEATQEDPSTKLKKERLEEVGEVMRRYLPMSVETVVKQHFFDNRTVEEIGQINGCSQETARQRLTFGLTRLKEICCEETAT